MKTWQPQYGKVLILASSLFLLSACNTNEESDELSQLQIYERFWHDFDLRYAGFSYSNVDWDSIYTAQTNHISDSTSDTELFQLLVNSIEPLKDGHIELKARIDNKDYFYSYYPILQHSKPYNYITWACIKNHYLSDIVYINNYMAYGKIKGENIGYIIITSFAQSEEDYLHIDDFLQTFADSDGIIIDIRENGGGNELHAQTIAGRFTQIPITYRYQKGRSGANRTSLSEYYKMTLSPSGKYFAGKVAFLTNRTTYSAAEDFALMLKALPTTTQIGDTTWGGASTGPKTEMLENGWSYSLPERISYDLNYEPIFKGIAPDITMHISKSDSIAERDRIIETAVEYLLTNR